MNQHLDKYLCDKYPKIFSERNLTPQESCMSWGFSHGDGWFFLLDTLCDSIQSRIDNPPYVYKKTFKVYLIRAWNSLIRLLRLAARFHIYGEWYERGHIPQVVAKQVKEKFAGLRFYYQGGDELIDGMVAMATSLSYRICEHCGVMNELVNCNSDGWIQTTCPCCTEDKKSHLENRRMELVDVWAAVKQDTLQKSAKTK